MSGGGKSSTQENNINKDLAKAAKPLIKKAGKMAEMPYIPNRGIQFAAFSPMQEAGFQNTASAANAFGLANAGGATGMPPPQVSQEGYRGYSTGGLLDQILAASATPQQQRAIQQFVNPNLRQPIVRTA